MGSSCGVGSSGVGSSCSGGSNLGIYDVIGDTGTRIVH